MRTDSARNIVTRPLLARSDSPSHPRLPMNRTRVIQAMKLIGMWLPALLLVAIFLPQGWAKFSDASGWAVAFRHWGYPAWFRILIGIVELSAVGCLLSGRFAALGAMLIV